MVQNYNLIIFRAHLHRWHKSLLENENDEGMLAGAINEAKINMLQKVIDDSDSLFPNLDWE